MQLGYVGLGKMGAPMAERLLAAGHELVLYDARAAAVEPFLGRSARAAGSVAALAREVDTVLVCLPTPDVVRKVAGEIAAAGGKVRTFVDLSTTGPRVEAEVAAALKEKGIAACDSPVSGGVAGAKKGTLAVMLACPRDLREMLESLLAPLGKVFYLGERPGLGQTMKLANNLLSAAAMAITSEAVVMGVKAGLDARQMIDIINAGSGRNTATDGKFPRSVLPRTFDYGFSNGHMYKDVKLCLEVAEEVGVPMWVGAAVRQLWAYSSNHMGPDADFTTVVKCIEEWAGVEVGGKSA
jgi:3-hydroxyisobutyrate dehydrogenase-like beta-hydroxyacid dehydrogenase